MKVSIIISAHKPSRYLDESIKSAIDQKFDDFEVILSSDGCSELKWYADNYKIGFVLSPKGGHSQALNNSAKIAQGKYIKDHHWDDILLPNCLADLYEKDGADIIYGNAINFFPSGERLFVSQSKIKWKSFLPMPTSPIHGAAFITKRETFLEVRGFDESMDWSEELDYYMRLYAQGRTFKHVNSTVARYRQHTDSQTGCYDIVRRARVALYLNQKFSNEVI